MNLSVIYVMHFVLNAQTTLYPHAKAASMVTILMIQHARNAILVVLSALQLDQITVTVATGDTSLM